MDSPTKIEFTFSQPHRHVKCYLKPSGYDVYVDRMLVKTDADGEWVNMFKRLMNTRQVL